MASDSSTSAYCEQYRATAAEQARTADLLRIVPKGRESVLDIGARDGHFSRLLTQYFTHVTALDLQRPAFEYPGVETVAGNATRLAFPDSSFDCVFCTEVLEHIPELEKACSEISRVARHEVIIGVPYKQDLRMNKTRCSSCGKRNPPWGHVNSFDEHKLVSLFPRLRPVSTSFVGTREETTSGLASLLMDLGGNPWGPYDQEEPCMYCGAKLVAPVNRPIWQKVCSAMAVRLDSMQAQLAPNSRGGWIHILFSKSA